MTNQWIHLFIKSFYFETQPDFDLVCQLECDTTLPRYFHHCQSIHQSNFAKKAASIIGSKSVHIVHFSLVKKGWNKNQYLGYNTLTPGIQPEQMEGIKDNVTATEFFISNIAAKHALFRDFIQ